MLVILSLFFVNYLKINFYEQMKHKYLIKNNLPNLKQDFIKDIGPPIFKKLIDQNIGIVIDLRTPQELKSYGVITTKNLLNLNMYDASFLDKLQKLDKNKIYLIYCRS